MRMERLLSVLKGETKRAVGGIDTKGISVIWLHQYFNPISNIVAG